MKVILPNGFIDGGDHFNVVFLDELKGKQQNYLADKELVIGNVGHIPKILNDVIHSIQTDAGVEWKGGTDSAINQLPAGDLQTILIKLRENTYGPRFYLEAECPHCQHLNKNLRIDLDTLAIDPMPLAEMLDKTKRTLVLPKSQQEVEVKPLYLRDIFEVLKITKNKQKELVTSVTALSIKRLGTNSKITSKDVEDLPVKDLMTLKNSLESMKLEGTIDTKIETTCTNCSKDFDSQLDVLSADFFDPSKDSMS